MAVLVGGSIALNGSLTDQRSAIAGSLLGIGQRTIPIGPYSWQISTGTAAGLADKVWGDTQTILTGATNTLDLAGTLTDSFGSTVTFVKLRAIIIYAALTNTTTVQLARPAATGSTLFGAASGALAALSAGGFICWADPGAGVSVGAGTTDLLSLINSAGASALCDVILVGTSA